VKPGILIITLHEGKAFSLSPHYQQIFNSHFQNPNASIRPNSSSSHTAQTANSYAPPARPQSTSSGINAAPTIHGRYLTKYLPYALLDFDKNQVFVDAVSGTPENPLWAGDNTAFKFDVSRQTELSIQIYLRNPAARPGAGRSEDIFLGATKMQPRLQENRPYVEDPKLSKKDNLKAAAEQEKTVGQLGHEWLELQFGTGSIKVGISFVENRARSMKIEDFDLLKGEQSSFPSNSTI
jgi:serum/glucocorticoid-regulated kinase 2